MNSKFFAVVLISFFSLCILVSGCESNTPVSSQTSSSSSAKISSSGSQNNTANTSQNYQSDNNLQTSDPFNAIFYNVSNIDFLSSQIGFLSLNSWGYKGSSNESYYTLLKTNDGGHSWNVVGNNKALYSTTFVDDKIGYGLLAPDLGNDDYPVIRDNSYEASTLVKTTDGGLSWNPVNFLDGKDVESADIINYNVIFLFTITEINSEDVYYSIYRTVDGGANWEEINTPQENSKYLEYYNWISAKEGYVLYDTAVYNDFDEKTLFYTDNGGKTWNVKSRSSTPLVNGNIITSSSIGNIPVEKASVGE